MFRRVLLLLVASGCAVISTARGATAPSIEDRVAKLEGDVQAMQKDMVDVASQMRDFHSRMLAVTKGLESQNAELREIVQQIGRQEGSAWVPAIRGNMDRNAGFRQEMADVVNGSLPREGLVRVSNQMGISCTLRVNQTPYTVPPLTSIDIRVPAGNVTTELVGYEQPKNWAIAAPNFTQVINITPRETAAPVLVGIDAFGAPVYAMQ